jgi:hypothetical protein
MAGEGQQAPGTRGIPRAGAEPPEDGVRRDAMDGCVGEGREVEWDGMGAEGALRGRKLRAAGRGKGWGASPGERAVSGQADQLPR